MAVITISRELGSGGTTISTQVAKRLGYPLIDKDLIETILKQYGMVEFDDLYQSATSIWARFDSSNVQLVKMLNKTILAFASRDHSVILGRGGFAILQDYVNVINVRIQAPLAERVQRLMVTENLNDYRAAEERIKENDRVRNTFIETFYHVKWDAADYFDLVLDTSRVTIPMAIDWIVSAAHELDRTKIRPGMSTREIDIDPVLAKTITDLMAARNIA